MGVYTSVAQKVEAPPLEPIAAKSKLAGTPGKPKYSVKVKNAKGEEVVVADPNATRALVALMNVHAVVGGAAVLGVDAGNPTGALRLYEKAGMRIAEQFTR